MARRTSFKSITIQTQEDIFMSGEIAGNIRVTLYVLSGPSARALSGGGAYGIFQPGGQHFVHSKFVVFRCAVSFDWQLVQHRRLILHVFD